MDFESNNDITLLLNTFSRRLHQLEQWLELAIRPSLDDLVDASDGDLLRDDDGIDDLIELQKRCNEACQVRNDLWTSCSSVRAHHVMLDDELQPLPSQVPEAGLGLFFKPKDTNKCICQGETICYYWGHVHNFRSAKQLRNRSYLMLVQGHALVDPGPLLFIKARYINDPCNELLYNVQFSPEQNRSAVIATRDIEPGEELFVAYGDAYWTQQPFSPRIMTNSEGLAKINQKRPQSRRDLERKPNHDQNYTLN